MALKIGDNKIKLSWDDLEILVDKLCKKIPFETPTIDSVTGIARGGLIPAVMVSHKLGLPYVDAVGPNTLVIDDIADSGATLEKSPGIYTAVLHYKPHTSSFIPTIWAEEHNSDEWLIYPFERSDSKPMQDYLKSKEFNEFADFVDNSEKEFDHLKDGYYIAGMTNDKEGSFMKYQNKLGKKNIHIN
jgi:hypoxanthine phosphoribosyltransferase